jgi:tripartite-type tricarboxylate transporter receptor subunit TctC
MKGGAFFPMVMLRIFIASIALVLAIANAGQAQDWPNRPIRFIVPFPAGGSTDVAARVIGEYLSRTLGQQIVIENKSGASGVVGTEAAAKSAADGYSILIATDQVATWQHIFKLNFDPMNDLVPVTQLSRQPVVLAVHPKLGVDSLNGFVTVAKQRPRLGYATSGLGSQQHIAAAWFAKLAGITLEHVPYRGGGQAINDLVAGHIMVGSLGSSPLIPHYKAGTLRLLAQTTAERSPSLPDVPTYREAGFQELVLDQWLGVFVPAGTAPTVVDRLNAEVNKALANPTIRNSFTQSAQEPIGGSAAAFSQLVRGDFSKYERLVKELNIQSN